MKQVPILDQSSQPASPIILLSQAEGAQSLVANQQGKDQAAVAKELADTKELLQQYAAQIQAVFFYYECHGEKVGSSLGRMNLSQFKVVMTRAKVTGKGLSADKLDDVFSTVATSKSALDRKNDVSGASTFTLLDFMLALVHVGYHKAAAEKKDGLSPEYSPLNAKLENLLTEHIAANLYPELSKQQERLYNAFTTGAELLLKRGRKLTEQTLDSCQLKRVKSAEVQVDLRFLAVHLQRWNLLGREFSFQELATFAVFAKQEQAEVERFLLLPIPISLNYNEFERLLLGMAYHLYVMKKKTEPFEEFLGDTLDSVFKKAGVLVLEDPMVNDT